MADFSQYKTLSDAVALRDAVKQVDSRHAYGPGGEVASQVPLLEHNGTVFSQKLFDNPAQVLTLPGSIKAGSIITYTSSTGQVAYGQLMSGGGGSVGYYVKPLDQNSVDDLRMANPHLQMYALDNHNLKSTKVVYKRHRTLWESVLFYLPSVLLIAIFSTLLYIIITNA